MKPAALIITLTALLGFPSAAGAATGTFVAPTVHRPIVGLSRDLRMTIATNYELQVGDTATITYLIKRHRINGAGFKLVGTITRTVTTGNGTDQFHVNFNRIGGLWPGFGYRVHPVMLDLSTGVDDTAHAGRLHV